MRRYHDKSALSYKRNLFHGSEETLKVAVLPLLRPPQADETSKLLISLGFGVEKPSILGIPWLTDNLMSQQLVEFPFTRG